MENKFKIGNFLTELRKEKKLTQSELAEKLNISDKAVSKWENGKCSPDMEQLKKLAKLYNITIDELIYGERVANPKTIHEEITIESYNKLQQQSKIMKFSLVSLSLLFLMNLFSVLFIYLDLSFALIYSVSLFAVSLIIMLTIFGKCSRINSAKANKTINRQDNIANLKKYKKLNKICFIITICLSLLLLAFYVIGFAVEGFESIAITNEAGTVLIPIWLTVILYVVWSFSLIPAIMYVVMALKNPFFTGWMAGSFISIGWGAILLVIIPAPIFMVAYYYNAFKVFKLKE